MGILLSMWPKGHDSHTTLILRQSGDAERNPAKQSALGCCLRTDLFKWLELTILLSAVHQSSVHTTEQKEQTVFACLPEICGTRLEGQMQRAKLEARTQNKSELNRMKAGTWRPHLMHRGSRLDVETSHPDLLPADRVLTRNDWQSLPFTGWSLKAAGPVQSGDDQAW